MPFEDAEISCNDCPGNGYFIVHVNKAWNGKYFFACPKCGRKHPRSCKDGNFVGQEDYSNAEHKFLEKGSIVKKVIERDSGDDKDRSTIFSPPSAWSPKPRLDQMKLVNSGLLEHKAMAEAWARKAASDRGDIDRQEEWNGDERDEKAAKAKDDAALTAAAQAPVGSKKGLISRLFGKKQ